MLQRFSTLYAGHVDLPDMGREATPVNERRFDNAHLVSVFAKTEALARTADRLGFDTVWLAEHHFQHEGYECLPNLLMMAVHLCHLTENVHVGCGFNVAPMWHPLRLAEDFATADVLTGGRVRFGVGRGYHTREVEPLGGVMQDQDANRALFEEQVEVLMKAFHEESFSHQGTHYQLPPPGVPYRGYELETLTLVPRPLQQPVECWQPIVSASERGLDFMVRHGMSGVVGGGSALMAERCIAAWQEALQRAGIDARPGERLALGVNFHIAPTREQAIREATPFFEEHIKMFAPLGFFRGLDASQLAQVARRGEWAGAGVPTLDEACDAGGWYCGPAAGFVEYLEAMQDAYPALEMVNVQASMGTPERVMLEQLEQFAADVMPAFESAGAGEGS